MIAAQAVMHASITIMVAMMKVMATALVRLGGVGGETIVSLI